MKVTKAYTTVNATVWNVTIKVGSWGEVLVGTITKDTSRNAKYPYSVSMKRFSQGTLRSLNEAKEVIEGQIIEKLL